MSDPLRYQLSIWGPIWESASRPHCWVWRFNAAQAPDVQRALGACAADPQTRVTWYDVALASHLIRANLDWPRSGRWRRDAWN